MDIQEVVKVMREEGVKIKPLADELKISDCRFFDGDFPWHKEEDLSQALRKRAIILMNTGQDVDLMLKSIKRAGLRISSIAAKIGVSQQYVSAVLHKRDKTTASRLKEIHDIIKDIGNKLLKVSK